MLPEDERTDWLSEGRRVLAAQPFSRLIGAHLSVLTTQLCELRLDVINELTQHLGFVHGGVVGYLADSAMAFAAGPHLGPAIVTSDYSLSFCRPATETRLIARARVLSCEGRMAAVACEVFSSDGTDEKLCAMATGRIRAASTPATKFSSPE